MKRYIYIFTDCNRTYLHVALSNELKTTNSDQAMSGFFDEAHLRTSRLIYQESLPSEEMALKRFQELSQYTRMQKERLIRRYNPNWIDLNNRITISPSRLPIRIPFGAKLPSPRPANVSY